MKRSPIPTQSADIKLSLLWNRSRDHRLLLHLPIINTPLQLIANDAIDIQHLLLVCLLVLVVLILPFLKFIGGVFLRSRTCCAFGGYGFEDQWRCPWKKSRAGTHFLWLLKPFMVISPFRIILLASTQYFLFLDYKAATGAIPEQHFNITFATSSGMRKTCLRN